MADESLSEISVDVSKLKVQDLKKELKMRGLPISGNKNELVERLQGALKPTDVVGSESVDDLEEDLLNDDDDVHLDASESVILENELDDSPKSQKRKLDENSEKVDAESKTAAPPPLKKVILNRNVCLVEPLKLVPVSNDKEKESTIDKTEIETNEEKKIIKLSQLSVKERLEMRAKKFGVTAFSDDAKKLARAERFGANTSAGSITSNATSASVDVLKQRAQRFGSSVSPLISTLEQQEKLEKRKARFGLASSNGVTNNETVKQQRLERFKKVK